MERAEHVPAPALKGEAPQPGTHSAAGDDGEGVDLEGVSVTPGAFPAPWCRGCPVLPPWRHLGGLGGEMERLVGLLANEIEAAMLRNTVTVSRAAGRRPAAAPITVLEPPGVVERLTPRQQEVLSLLLRRATDREIAETLGIALDTVRSHTAAVRAKHGVQSRRALSPSLLTN